MKIRRKVVSQLLLTQNEIADLMDMIAEAEKGTTVHYSERVQPNGSFFAIGIDPNANKPEMPRQQPKAEEARYEEVYAKQKY